jgi:hypothetical protein
MEKKYRDRGKHSRQSDPRLWGSKRWRAWWLVAVGFMAVGIAVMAVKFAANGGSTRHAPEPVKNAMIPSPEPASGDAAWDQSWPSLPGSGQPARPIEVVRQAYAFAARRGDVLQYLPCYCGCERQGHRSNRDCFLKGKTAAGLPSWDAMGYT